MVDLVIVGSIGLDDIETPFGKVDSALGGSAVYASSAASYFTKPGIISIMGDDLPPKHLEFLKKFDITGISKKDKTFHWTGFYEYDMNEAKTLKTELNSLAEFDAVVPPAYRAARYLLLGNSDPQQQIKVLSQMTNKPFVILDTMNFYISSKRDKLIKAISKVDFLVINEGEARQLCATPNLIKAGKMLLAMGPKYVAIKKGEHGALLFSPSGFFSAPGYPLEAVKDPTGCGDSFAGGLIGYLAKNDKTDELSIRRGIIYGSAIASFCAEDFSLEYKKNTHLKDIRERYKIFREIRKF